MIEATKPIAGKSHADCKDIWGPMTASSPLGHKL